MKVEEKGKGKMVATQSSEESFKETHVKKIVQPLRRSQRTSVQEKIMGAVIKAGQGQEKW